MSRLPTNWQVLVVEADRVFSASLALKYALHGHYAKFAQSGSEALVLMSFFEPTLAILGTELPDLTGPELATVIESRFPSCRIVFLSDRPSSHFSSKAVTAGVHGPDVLIKSVHPETVYQEVSEIVHIDAAWRLHTPESGAQDTF
jgi:DNA-binding response OmpR family regulator